MANLRVNFKDCKGSSGVYENITTSGSNATGTKVTAAHIGNEIELWTDSTKGAIVSIGAAPNASSDAGRFFIPPLWPIYVVAGPGCKVAVVDAS